MLRSRRAMAAKYGRATVRAGSKIASLGEPLRVHGMVLANQGDVEVRTIREEGCGEAFAPAPAGGGDEVLKYQVRAFWDLKDHAGRAGRVPVRPDRPAARRRVAARGRHAARELPNREPHLRPTLVVHLFDGACTLDPHVCRPERPPRTFRPTPVVVSTPTPFPCCHAPETGSEAPTTTHA